MERSTTLTTNLVIMDKSEERVLDFRHGIYLNRDSYDNTKRQNVLFRQIIANAGPLLLMTCHGIVTGYSAILLPQLEQDVTINPTKVQESWIASLAPLQMAVGCLFCGWSMEQFGRRSTNVLSCILASTGWLTIYFSTSVEYLLIGRVITGFCVGASGVSIACYIAEVSLPNYRGFFLSGISFGIAFGIFIAHLTGTFFTWRTSALIVSILPLVAMISIAYSPESHVWYANWNKLERAKRSFKWYRGDSEEGQSEIYRLLRERTKVTLYDKIVMCKSPQFLKPLSIAVFYFVVTQFTGNNSVAFYAVTIMQSTVKNVNKYVAMLIVDVIRVIMSVIACILTKKFRARPLTMISGFGTAVSLYLLSGFVYLSSLHPTNQFYSIVPLIMLISYIVLMNIGLIPISWTLCGELFNPATKGLGGGISSCMNFLSFFIVVKASFDMFDTLGTAVTFTIFASTSLLGSIVLFFILPETRNKTLRDIEDSFDKKANKT